MTTEAGRKTQDIRERENENDNGDKMSRFLGRCSSWTSENLDPSEREANETRETKEEREIETVCCPEKWVLHIYGISYEPVLL